MNKKVILGMLGVIGLASVALLACSKQEKTKLIPKKIEMDTHVAASGQMLDKFVYYFDSKENVNFEKSDFTIKITDTSEDFTTKEKVVKKITPTISKVTVTGKRLVIDIKDLPYKTISDIKIKAKDKSLNSTMKDYKLKTKTADKFVKHSFTDSQGTKLTYWLYTPKKASKLPLVVWEHGGGEVLASSTEGSQLVASQGATIWIENGYKASVLSVQYPENYSFGISEIPEELSKMEAYNKAKVELIQTLVDKGIVDKSRIYLTGASSGGGAALRFIMQYPDLFAGALVSSAKDTVAPISLKYNLAYQLKDKEKLKISDEEYQATFAEMKNVLAQYPEIVKVPIWFVQAKNDQVTTSYTSIMMNDILNEMGAKQNHITLYSDEEMEKAGVHNIHHGSWQLAYKDKKMLDWLFDQKKK
ncbi:carboxylesterase family protein [Streptococcus orisasini]